MSIEKIFEVWLEEYLQHADILNFAIKDLADRMHDGPETIGRHIKNLPLQFRTQLLERVYLNRFVSPVQTLCYHLLKDFSRPLKADEMIIKATNWFPRDKNFCMELMSAAFTICPEKSPALWASVNNGISFSLFCTLFDRIAEIAQYIPGLPIAWGIEPSFAQQYLNNAPESRGKTIFRESIIFPNETIRNNSGQKVWQVYAEKDKQVKKTLRYIKSVISSRIKADGEIIDNYLQVLSSTFSDEKEKKDKDPQMSQVARSAAERWLFDFLNIHPRTKKLFKLNQKLPIPFGSRKNMEVDLMSATHRIVIEIDGYYHFTDKKTWLKDRRKDYLLQRNRFFILRFHASDVVTELEAIIDTIIDVIDCHKFVKNEI